MNYQEVFMRVYKFYIVFFIIGGIAVIYFSFSKSYWSHFKLDKKGEIIYKSLMILVFAGYTVMSVVPIVRDKAFIDSNEYIKMEKCMVVREVMGGGLLNRFENIKVNYKGQEYQFEVAWAEADIKKGDIVKVSYLPYSTYAIVEKTK